MEISPRCPHKPVVLSPCNQLPVGCFWLANATSKDKQTGQPSRWKVKCQRGARPLLNLIADRHAHRKRVSCVKPQRASRTMRAGLGPQSVATKVFAMDPDSFNLHIQVIANEKKSKPSIVPFKLRCQGGLGNAGIVG